MRFCCACRAIEGSESTIAVQLSPSMAREIAHAMTTAPATARSDLGATYQMQVISAILLGGTSFTGGRGKVFGSVLGVLFFAILSNGFNLAGASPFTQQVINGALLIIVLVVRAAMDRQKEKQMIRQTREKKEKM